MSRPASKRKRANWGWITSRSVITSRSSGTCCLQPSAICSWARSDSNGGGKNPELTVCQIRQAAGSLVRSLWLTGQVRLSFLRVEAEIITEVQWRNLQSQICHVRKRRRQLRKL